LQLFHLIYGAQRKRAIKCLGIRAGSGNVGSGRDMRKSF